ncbi:ABC transporter substrate-binding protein [Phenylobacterium sp.]|uniref:substrate-binding periplasmic protein n=1 Tax=Phenylobacterium sp. TaxID=1871053 RepID=UPI00301BBE65
MKRRSLLAGLSAIAAGCAPRDDVRARGGYVVGSTATGVPFSFLDVKTNSLTGAMIDIAQAVARQAGFPVTLSVVPFSALIPSITARRIDVIAAAMLRTPEREQVVAFTDPVYAYGGAIVARVEDARSYAALADLQGLRVGAQVGTRFVEQLQKAGVSGIKTYDSLADVLRDLRLGRLDAAYGDEPIIRYYLRVTRSAKLKLVDGYRARELEEVCLVLRKADPRLQAVNAAIGEIRATEIAAILRTWGL